MVPTSYTIWKVEEYEISVCLLASPPWEAFGHSCPSIALASPVASSGCRHFSPIYMTPGTKKSSKKSVKEVKRGGSRWWRCALPPRRQARRCTTRCRSLKRGYSSIRFLNNVELMQAWLVQNIGPTVDCRRARILVCFGGIGSFNGCNLENSKIAAQQPSWF